MEFSILNKPSLSNDDFIALMKKADKLFTPPYRR